MTGPSTRWFHTNGPSLPLDGIAWRGGCCDSLKADLGDRVQKLDRLVMRNMLLGLSRLDIGQG